MISRYERKDFYEICQLLNELEAYTRIVFPGHWHCLPITPQQLADQFNEGVQYWVYRNQNRITGVMGVHYKDSVCVIIQACERMPGPNKEIGSMLLKHITEATEIPVIIAVWVVSKETIEFYREHGFETLADEEKSRLLPKYWDIPAHQIRNCVVLASPNYTLHISIPDLQNTGKN